MREVNRDVGSVEFSGGVGVEKARGAGLTGIGEKLGRGESGAQTLSAKAFTMLWCHITIKVYGVSNHGYCVNYPNLAKRSDKSDKITRYCHFSSILNSTIRYLFWVIKSFEG